MEVERPGGKLTFAVERAMEEESAFVKYNNNSGFVDLMAHRLTPQAFTRFSFDRSAGSLMVVDIQGCDDVYTDPQIHTSDGTDYGEGNLGVGGMALFFSTSHYDALCERLGLLRFALSAAEERRLEASAIEQRSARASANGGSDTPASATQASPRHTSNTLSEAATLAADPLSLPDAQARNALANEQASHAWHLLPRLPSLLVCPVPVPMLLLLLYFDLPPLTSPLLANVQAANDKNNDHCELLKAAEDSLKKRRSSMVGKSSKLRAAALLAKASRKLRSNRHSHDERPSGERASGEVSPGVGSGILPTTPAVPEEDEDEAGGADDDDDAHEEYEVTLKALPLHYLGDDAAASAARVEVGRNRRGNSRRLSPHH